MTHQIEETVAWIIVSGHRLGGVRGLEKSTGTFYLTEDDAKQEHNSMILKEFFQVHRVIIRSAREDEHE